MKQVNWSFPFKVFLVVLGTVIVLVYAFYTQHMVNELRRNARHNLSVLVENYKLKILTDPSAALSYVQKIGFPLILTDSSGKPKFWRNIDIPEDLDSLGRMEYLRRRVHSMDVSGHQPVAIEYNGIRDYFHYDDSPLIRQVQFFPYLGLIFIGVFIIMAFLGFSNLKREEQSMIWIGMARETAHQLGTPISSLMGWMELIKFSPPDEATFQAMQVDLDRLQKIASRFSKIGSKVDLKEQPIVPVLRNIVAYFRNRLPVLSKNVILEEEYPQEELPLKFNAFLMEWVFENLIKNALDAIQEDVGFIKVSARYSKNRDWLVVDVVDSGKGMDQTERKKAFRPGFSTKKRGWGLGLSLARRIVEEAHHGKLFISDTRPGVGSVMRVMLRVERKDHA